MPKISLSFDLNENLDGVFDFKTPNKQSYVVNFPGIIINNEKALKMLGGLESIAQSFISNESLNLNARPKMIYSKPISSNNHNVIGFIMKIQKFRSKTSSKIKYKVEIDSMVFKYSEFTKLFNFEYGPFEKEGDVFSVFYDALVLDEPTLSLDNFLKKSTPIYVPAINFIRDCGVFPYKMAPKFHLSEYIEIEDSSQVMPSNRKDRKNHTFFREPTDPCPLKPSDELASRIDSTYHKTVLAKIQALFAERPIWSKTAITFLLPNIGHNKLKFLIPCLAYFSPSGPWKRLWIRFGYDPYTTQDARKYQLLDFRINPSNRLNHAVLKAGPNESQLPWQDFLLQEIEKNKQDFHKGSDESEEEEETKCVEISHPLKPTASNRKDFSKIEGNFRLNEKSWPASKQVYYQLIDIDIPEITSLYERPACRSVCCLTNGWLEENYSNTARLICQDYLKRWISNVQSRVDT